MNLTFCEAILQSTCLINCNPYSALKPKEYSNCPGFFTDTINLPKWNNCDCDTDEKHSHHRPSIHIYLIFVGCGLTDGGFGGFALRIFFVTDSPDHKARDNLDGYFKTFICYH